MTDTESHLHRLGLFQYYDALVAEGFDTWESLLDIQEGDLEALHVRLGHRRKLQRAIAEYRGLASDRPLVSPTQDPDGGECAKSDTVSHASSNRENNITTPSDQKRRYRRHPKPDEHAPEKPPSAYVLFSNRVREDVKSQNLSFTDIARLVGERWQKLDPALKERFDLHATKLKDNFNAQLADYKKTEAYKEYMQYLADFKAKHTTTSEFKRPKLDQYSSSSLSGASGDSRLSENLSHASGGSFDSSSTVSVPGQLPGASLPLATPSDVPSAAIGTGSLMNQGFQERRLPDTMSVQSLNSEDNVSSRFDQVDALSQTTEPSSNTPPTGTSLSPSTSSRPHRRDYGPGSGIQHWSHRPASFPYESLTTLGLTQINIDPSVPGSKVAAEQWRHKPVEARSYYISAALQPPQRLGSVPISQLVSPTSSQEPGFIRTLPPLRQSTSTPTNFPSNIFAGNLTASTIKPILQTLDVMPLRQGQSHVLPDQSEIEAASILAEVTRS